MDPVVYLAGGINGLSDADAKDWRELAKTYLRNTLDPMRRDYRGKESEHVDDIVKGDLIDICACDVVLAMCPKPSWGTGMEIFFAHSIGRTVFAIVSDRKKASPWLAKHATLCESLEEAIDLIAILFRRTR